MNSSKLAKRTDAQLLHSEKLNKWRTSEKNKKQFKKAGVLQSKFTYEIAKEIRDKFYFENEMLGVLAKEYKISLTNMRELLKNESYKVDQWDYPDYEKQKEINEYIKNRIDEKIQFIKNGYGPLNFCEKFQCANIVYYRLVKKYKIQTPNMRNGPKRKKYLED